MNAPTIAVIGGGFSGTMVAYHLLRQPGGPRRVVLIERQPPAGRGVAYGTPHEQHLLNVPAGRMGADPGDPDGFLRFLGDAQPGDFVPRRRYGEYLAALLADARRPETWPEGSDLEVWADDAIGLTPGREVVLAHRPPLAADAVVLALGHFPPAHPLVLPPDRPYVGDPWSARALAPAGEVLLVGAGLTAIDLALALGDARVHFLSRSGRLPRPHGQATPVDLGELPTTTALALLTAVRGHLQDKDWRAVFDALRPRTQALWSALPAAERQRLIRHARSFWEPHRHRLAPQVASQVEQRLASGQWQVHAGRLADLQADGTATIRPRGGGEPYDLHVNRVVNCAGPEGDARRLNDPLVVELLARGLAKPDLIGLLTDAAGALVGRDGRASTWLYTLGPLRKGQLWETTAVPELRVQALELARTLLDLPHGAG
ncbi:MAG: Hydroxyacylglutathione hydrolase [Cyanobacteria bacterium RYN_339]|nr:Hydroxyacylglutathione hydrolase [Cyanobacteria bacterium RYN_339]